MKLRGKITVTFALVTALALVISGIVLLRTAQSRMETQNNQALETSVTLAAGEISGMLGEYLNEVQSTAISLTYTDVVSILTPDQESMREQMIAAGVDPDMMMEQMGDFDPENMDESKMADIEETPEMLAMKEQMTAVVEDAINRMCQVYTFTSGNLLTSNGMSLMDGTSFTDREYVQRALAGEANISAVNQSKLTGNWGFSVAAPINVDGKVSGVVYYRMEMDFISKILDNIKVSENSYAYLIDGEGNIICHPNAENIMNYNVYTSEDHLLTNLQADITSGNIGIAEYTISTGDVTLAYAPIEYTDGWVLLVCSPTSDVQKGIRQMGRVSSYVLLLAVVVMFIVSSVFGKWIGTATGNVERSLRKMSEGDFSEKFPDQIIGKDELASLGRSAKTIAGNFINILGEANAILEGMANYDLSMPDMNEYPGEFNKLSVSINEIKAILNDLISEVNEAASSVNVGASELSDAADALAGGTMEQANSIDQVLGDINNIAEGIKNNADNETIVEEKLKNLDVLIQRGNDEMTTLLDIVKDVENMSADIKKIVNTIDSIAFQTNILALNASVEAARAGENGKGFAVVADEVGNLAAKTAEASKQTSEMIETCIDGIEKALKNAESTFDVLSSIVSNSAEIAGAFEQIAEDTKVQSDNSESIRAEIKNIASVVQTNTATAEETSAATVELSGQAERLSNLIGRFKTEDTLIELENEDEDEK